MIESILVVTLVAGAAAFAGWKLRPARRAKGRPAGEETGCACPGCPTAKQGPCSGERTTG